MLSDIFLLLSWLYVDLHLVVLFSSLKVMASKTKIYIVMELVTGGELFDKIVSAWPFLSTSELLFMLCTHVQFVIIPVIGFAWEAERG